MKYYILTLIALVAITSCRKDRHVLDNTVANDNSLAENIFNDMFKVVEDVSSQTDGIREDGVGCIDTIIVDTTSNPRSVTIDFGTDDCVGLDGRIRKGVLFITYTGRYREEGTVITVAPQNYSVNGYTINGSKTIENLGLNSQDQLHYSIEVLGTLTAPGNAWTSSWNSSRVRTWVEGESTIGNIWDDAYEISGTASGINRFGTAYTMAITSPLRAEIGCAWIVSGSLTLTPQGADTRVVNFGSGACNNGFTVTVNGESEEFNGGD